MTQPTKDDNYVTLKLSTGEVLVGILRAESATSFTVEYPFHLKNYPRFVEGGVIETITAGPFCGFTADRIFELPKKDVLFCKKMHPFAVPFYLSLWNQHETPMRVDKDGKMIPDGDNSREPMSMEDVRDRIESLIGRMQEIDMSQEEEEEYLEELGTKRDKKTLH